MPRSNINYMTGGSNRAAPAPGNVLELLPLAGARPNEALAKAHAILSEHPGPHDASVAHQIIGIVLRDFGDAQAGIRELRTSLRLATAVGSEDRRADVLATLGLTLVCAGRTRSGLTNLDAAVRQAVGLLAGQILMRRAMALWRLGRHRDALCDLRQAVTALRRAGDTMWEARALSCRGLVHLALGSTERADADFSTAERLFAATSQDLERAYTTHNRGLVAFRSGNLPLALSYLDQAARRYEVLGTPVAELSIDRCAVLLAAGLSADALNEVDAAIRDLEQVHGQATKKAELLLAAASAALAAADPQTALQRAQAACHLFGRQQRPWWHAHAAFLLLQARYAADMVSGRLLRDSEGNAARLESLGSREAPQARLLAGRVALALGRATDADRQFAIAALARRRRGPALSRLNGWLAEALRADAAANPRRLLGACRRGLDLIEEHRLTLGASELRARATAWGAELAELAQRCALESGKPRLLLAWSERWRATALAVPPVRPIEDQELQADLTAAREVTSRLEKARAEGTPAAALEREQLRLESAVRARVIRTRGTWHASRRGGVPADNGFDPAVLLAELGPLRLIQIVDVGGDLHLLVCGDGRVRHVTAGRREEAAREVDYARFGLNRLAHGRGGADRHANRAGNALAILEATGRRLEDILIGRAARYLGDGGVVIVPPGRLHAVPWALLPSLRERAVSVSPSASAWLRARAVARPEGHDLVLVRGPGTETWGAEVPALAAEYANAAMLGSGTATAARVLEAMDGASLVHIAAHGTFRADSPMFSSLRLDDGPLTVHDFERLRRAPYRMVLSSCDSGLLAPAGADELLGLTSTLIPLGTVGIAACMVPVNDKAVAELMLALHRRLRRGGTLAESLRDARADIGDDDPVQTATGWSFIALGAG